jgi:hypothetical protein
LKLRHQAPIERNNRLTDWLTGWTSPKIFSTQEVEEMSDAEWAKALLERLVSEAELLAAIVLEWLEDLEQ